MLVEVILKLSEIYRKFKPNIMPSIWPNTWNTKWIKTIIHNTKLKYRWSQRIFNK